MAIGLGLMFGFHFDENFNIHLFAKISLNSGKDGIFPRTFLKTTCFTYHYSAKRRKYASLFWFGSVQDYGMVQAGII